MSKYHMVLPEGVEESVQKIAEREGVSKEEVIRTIFKVGLIVDAAVQRGDKFLLEGEDEVREIRLFESQGS